HTPHTTTHNHTHHTQTHSHTSLKHTPTPHSNTLPHLTQTHSHTALKHTPTPVLTQTHTFIHISFPSSWLGCLIHAFDPVCVNVREATRHKHCPRPHSFVFKADFIHQS